MRTDPERARELILEFAEFTRYSFRAHGEYTTLAEELRSIDRYLTIERARYGDRLQVRLQIAPEVLPVSLPFLCLQPLVENAVRHGLSRKLMRRLARDRILVECCVSSNYHTGAVKPGARHPIHALLEAGVPVAVCCDNTTVSRTDQVRESARVAESIGLETVERIHRAAEEFSFIQPGTALASTDDD